MGRTPKDIKDAVLAASSFVVADMLEVADALSEAAKRLMVTRQLLSHFLVPSTWQKKQMLQ